MSRRVVFPLKLKLIVIMATLIGGSIALYATFALDLFQKDKSAYIFGTNKSTNESFQQQVSNEIERNVERLKLLSSINRTQVQPAFKKFNDFYSLNIYDSSKRNDFYYNIDNIEKENLSVDEFKEINESLIKKDGINISSEKSLSFITLQVKEMGTTVVANISLNSFKKISEQFPLYDSYILNIDGSVFWSQSNEDLFSKKILSSGLNSSVLEVSGKEEFILAFQKNEKQKLIFVSKVKKKFAYKVNDYLVNKTKIFAIVILSLAGFISLLFSRSLTYPLEILYKMTLKFSNGEFGETVKINSKDEIGSLGDSFNFMSKEIVRYMGEMKEKARLETEIKTAKYVQSTYFPKENIDLEKSTISSFYTPAAECGGDWWGYIEAEDKLVVIITDATGHGVPAALLTATAHCCVENIKQLANSNPELISSPSNILEFMNKSIMCLEGKLLMTAFCCVIDFKEKYVLYSNASHNPPLIFNNDSTPTKDSFSPMLGANGPRLGHVEFGDYKENSVAFTEDQRIILFTDGILESTNKEMKEYGQRRFLKSIINNISKSNFNFQNQVINDAWNFFDGEPINDDITLVSVDLGSTKGLVYVDLDSELTLTSDLKLTTDLHKSEFVITDKFNNIDDNTFFISDKSDEENILSYLSDKKLSHLIGGNAKRIDLEVKSNFDQYFNGNGVSNYISNNNILEIEYQSKKDFEKVEKTIEEFNYEKCFQSPVDYLKIMSNELLTNALYHSGDESRSDLERSIDIELPESDKIIFKIGSDSNFLAISVKDSSGKLTKEIILSNLKRSFETKEHQNENGGAGLGLYLAYSYSNQFIVSTNIGVSSEVICIIDVNKRFKHYKERITSFHYFEQKGNS